MAPFTRLRHIVFVSRAFLVPVRLDVISGIGVRPRARAVSRSSEPETFEQAPKLSPFIVWAEIEAWLVPWE